MMDVLVYEDPDAGHWVAVNWPDQTIQVSGSTRDVVQDSFVDTWNQRMGGDVTAEDFRFFGPILTTAHIVQESEERWTATAYADRPYSGGGATVEEAKTDFIRVWNAEYEWATPPITEENVDWIQGR